MNVRWDCHKNITEIWLVVTGTWLDYDFPYIGNVIIPTDELIFFQRGGEKPPTRICLDYQSGLGNHNSLIPCNLTTQPWPVCGLNVSDWWWLSVGTPSFRGTADCLVSFFVSLGNKERGNHRTCMAYPSLSKRVFLIIFPSQKFFNFFLNKLRSDGKPLDFGTSLFISDDFWTSVSAFPKLHFVHPAETCLTQISSHCDWTW